MKVLSTQAIAFLALLGGLALAQPGPGPGPVSGAVGIAPIVVTPGATPVISCPSCLTSSAVSRTKFIAPATFRVNSVVGTDIGACLTANGGGTAACRTGQYVVASLAASYDMGGQTVTIFLESNGGNVTTYAGITLTSSLVGGGIIVINASTLTPTNVTSSAGTCLVTVASTVGLANGNTLAVMNVNGTVEANGSWVIGGLTATTFTLTGCTFTNAFLSSPSAVVVGQVVMTNGPNGYTFAIGSGAVQTTNFYIENVRAINPVFPCIGAQAVGLINYGQVDFGPCAGAQVFAGVGGTVNAFANYVISGAAPWHMLAASQGSINNSVKTVWISGVPNISAFAAATRLGIVDSEIVTYRRAGLSTADNVTNCSVSGSCTTGVRYTADTNGVIYANNALGVNYLPGNSAGTLSPYGVYQ